MANEMLLKVAISYFWHTVSYDFLEGNMICFGGMAESGCVSSSDPGFSGSFGEIGVSRNCLPVSCDNCYLNFTEWVHEYYTHLDRLVKYCQDHGLIKNECFCAACDRECRLDLNKKAWRCDSSYVKNKQKRKL